MDSGKFIKQFTSQKYRIIGINLIRRPLFASLIIIIIR